MPVGRQDPQKRTAREQQPMCVVCHSVEAAWKKGGSKPYTFREIPKGLCFANGKDVYCVASPRWCNACRLAYYGKKLPLKKLPITLLMGISMPISVDFTITHAGITTNPRELLTLSIGQNMCSGRSMVIACGLQWRACAVERRPCSCAWGVGVQVRRRRSSNGEQSNAEKWCSYNLWCLFSLWRD